MDTKSSLPSNYYLGVRKEILPFLPARRQRILEVGCGEGAFSEVVDGYLEYWGVEPNLGAAQAARQRLNKVLLGNFDDVADDLPDNYFDLVVCNDVIEHMPDHDEFFIKVQSKIADGGVLVASIPNVRFYNNLRDLLIGKNWQYQDSGILDRTHLRFFTRKSLLECLDRSGFEVQQFEGINGLKMRFMPLNRIFRPLMFCLLGSDVRYRQFAFRVAKKKKNDASQSKNNSTLQS
jgi:2-polyprenyl-3-methyl-5-hydroxy-6-metoxy-1,4-benzoquinol methylase